jgi:hypothetical protein
MEREIVAYFYDPGAEFALLRVRITVASLTQNMK